MLERDCSCCPQRGVTERKDTVEVGYQTCITPFEQKQASVNKGSAAEKLVATGITYCVAEISGSIHNTHSAGRR
jgi:hypothetical protein